MFYEMIGHILMAIGVYTLGFIKGSRHERGVEAVRWGVTKKWNANQGAE